MITYDLVIGCERVSIDMPRHPWDGVHVMITAVDAAPICTPCAKRWELILRQFRDRGTPLRSFRVEYAHPIAVPA